MGHPALTSFIWLTVKVLVGPAFVVTFTFSALLMGFLADNFSRPKETAMLMKCQKGFKASGAM